MATTADRLALLQRTKAGQRALLEKMYPDLDFSTVPFREYARLFTGRKYVPGFVGGWKAYGRSNSEDASTRDILPDYSGNGRDIRLYNFAFEGMSGFGGYGSTWTAYGDSAEQIDSNTIRITATRLEGVLLLSLNKGESYTVKYRITGLPSGSSLDLYINTKNSENVNVYRPIRTITEDGVYTDTVTWDSENAANASTKSSCFLLGRDVSYPEDMTILAEQLPLYPGGLVSDGVDDYGQCVKDFALPDDYTIVAVRKTQNSSGSFIGKSGSNGQGAFVFETSSGGTQSYGALTPGVSIASFRPALFSYQTKTSYNGRGINVGTGIDTEDDRLTLFTGRAGNDVGAYALYDLRIYDHSLTAEELQLVKDEMMSDYENATGGGIADIHYVADWDAKDRNNEEEEPMRSQWTDRKTGKVISLNNFAYAGMSGWNGYAEDYTTWENYTNRGEYVITGTKITAKSVKQPIQPSPAMVMTERRAAISAAVPSYRIRITGLPSGGKLLYTHQPVSAENVLLTQIGSADGIYTVPEIPAGSRFVGFRIEMPEAFEEMHLQTPLVIEQLPLYPGALVSDGVDDYGQTAEAISEEVGTMLVHGDLLNPEMTKDEYILNTSPNNEGRLYLWKILTSGNMQLGEPPTKAVSPLMAFSRTPNAVQGTMTIGGYSATLLASCALYRLILIREQLDDAAVEFLKWKVDKEYRDWCKANGYEYAINQLTE